MTIIPKLHRRIEELEKDIMAYVRNLIRFPSMSGNEKEAQQYVRECMEQLGCTTVDAWEPDFNELKSHEAFISKRDSFEGSPNVVGTWKGSGGGHSLILNSHIDIVPEGDLSEWQFSPFGGELDNGILYGRGVSDMKGSKAAIFGAIQAIRDVGIHLRGDLIVQSVIEEETGSAGTLACALRGYSADAAIIPEPTGFRICPAQQGSTWFRLIVKGKSAHAGQRYLGVSAIEKGVLLIDAITRFETHLNTTYASPLYKDVPIAYAVNVGTISGGNWASSVPEKVVIEGRMGVPPQISLEQGWKMFEGWIQENASKDEWLSANQPEIEWFDSWWGPAMIPADHPIVSCVWSACQEHFGHNPEVVGTPWATDGRILTEFANTPALVFGPGTSAHCPDEFIPVKDLVDYAKILATVIIKWCQVIEGEN